VSERGDYEPEPVTIYSISCTRDSHAGAPSFPLSSHVLQSTVTEGLLLGFNKRKQRAAILWPAGGRGKISYRGFVAFRDEMGLGHSPNTMRTLITRTGSGELVTTLLPCRGRDHIHVLVGTR